MSRKPHRRSKRCFYGRPGTIPSEIPDKSPEWTRRASEGLQIKAIVSSRVSASHLNSHRESSTIHLPLSTISVSVALCSTRRILPNHPSPTIWRMSNSSMRCTCRGVEATVNFKYRSSSPSANIYLLQFKFPNLVDMKI